MQAQVKAGVAHALRCFREVQARLRNLRTLGLCGVRQGAANCPDLIGGAGGRQLQTTANFFEADQQFWRVDYFVHHYFHPNTPQLAAQDTHQSYWFLCPLTNSQPKSSVPPSEVLKSRSSESMIKLPNSAKGWGAGPGRPPRHRRFQEETGGG